MSKLFGASVLVCLAILSCGFLPAAATALLSPSDLVSYNMVEYWYLPTFYQTVEPAIGALKNLQGNVAGWQGRLVRQWDIDAFGLRTVGTAQVVTQTGLFTPDKVVDVEEWTVIPFAEAKSLHLVFIENRGSHPFCVMTDLKNGTEIYRTPDFAIASTVYNALASLILASGNSLAFPDLGATFRDVTPKDLWDYPV